MALIGNTAEERTWNYLLEKIGNAYGVAGIMGNLKAESGIIFNRVEVLCLNRLKENGKSYTDASYTSAVDNGKISRSEFLNPLPGKQYGYGLCQWTSPGRKAGLYDLCKERKVSIADEQTSLDFLIKELQTSYSSVLAVLKSAKSVKEASDIVLKKFECPANTGTSVQNTRTKYGQGFYDKYANKSGGVNMLDYKNYINSTGTHYISNSGSDENGNYHGGIAGDQTGNEWVLRSWYSRPWSCVLRYEKDSRVGEMLAKLGCAAALNNKIGYDQYQRDDYWKQLQTVGYDPSKITVACEADCSAGVIANTRATGYLLGIDALKKINQSIVSGGKTIEGASYTGNMRNRYKAAGFTVLTDTKYTQSTAYLLPGDILLYDAAHTATNVTKGRSASTTSTTTPTSTSTVLRKGSTGTDVKTLQSNLNQIMNAGLVVDGEFGTNTYNAVIAFQTKYGLSVDGKVGTQTQNKINELLKSNSSTDTPTTSSTDWVGEVTATELNVRSWAGTEYPNIKSYPVLKKGNRIVVKGSQKATNGDLWYKIAINNTTTGNKDVIGFVLAKYIKKI